MTHQAQDAWAKAAGLRPSKAQPCPMVVANRRCRLFPNGGCLCLAFSGVLDHARVWLGADGQRVLTAEPYIFANPNIAEFTTVLAKLGLDVAVSDESPWHPGYSVLVIVTRSPVELPSWRLPQWPEVNALLAKHGATAECRSGRFWTWHVPSPTGGHFEVRVQPRRRWCGIEVDRSNTTNRRAEDSRAWFRRHVWPFCGGGPLPDGTCWAWADKVEPAHAFDVLDAWVAQELTWGIPRDDAEAHR